MLIKNYKGIIEKSVLATTIIIKMAHVGLLVRNHNLPSTYLPKRQNSDKKFVENNLPMSPLRSHLILRKTMRKPLLYFIWILDHTENI